MELKFLIVSIFLIALIPACSADPADICPPEEYISPCQCDKWSDGRAIVFCYFLASSDAIIEALIRSRKYGYEYLSVVSSSIPLLPASLFQIKKTSFLFLIEVNLVQLFNEATDAKDLKHLYLAAVEPKRTLQWDLLAKMQNLRNLTIYEVPLRRLGEDFLQYAPNSLIQIDFRYCSFSELPDRAFAKVTYLKDVTIEMDPIKELKRSMFPYPARIQRLSFRSPTRNNGFFLR